MDQKQQNILLLAIAVVLVVGSWAFLWPPAEKITQGLDLQGGLSVILTAQESTTTPVTAAVMDRAELIVRNRVDRLGVREASIQRQGNDSMLVQIPGISNAQEALAVLGSTGQLEFVDVASITDSATVAAITTGDENVKLAEGSYEPFMTGEVVRTAAVSQNPTTGQIEVNVTMDSKGTQTWGDYTTANVGKLVAIVLDGTVQSAPVVNEPITDGQTQISRQLHRRDAKKLKTVLETGALPVTLEFSESRVVGPTLGQDSLRQGVLAALIGLALVAVYVVAFYRGLGLLTWVALLRFASIFLGVLALLSSLGLFALSLPGIAGVVLTIGLAADSSILILERSAKRSGWARRSARPRTRFASRHADEHRRRPRDAGLGAGALPGRHRAGPRVRADAHDRYRVRHRHDAAVQAAGARCCSLNRDRQGPGVLGRRRRSSRDRTTSEGEEGGCRQCLGSTSTSWVTEDHVRHLGRAPGSSPSGRSSSVDSPSASSSRVAPSITITDSKDVTIEQMREAFGSRASPIRASRRCSEGVRASSSARGDQSRRGQPECAAVAEDLELPDGDFQVTTIGPGWGKNVTDRALLALGLSIAAILLYISVRFEYKMSVTAVLALVHDIVITLGIYALVGREVTPNTVAALLTILGYSLYDTDRRVPPHQGELAASDEADVHADGERLDQPGVHALGQHGAHLAHPGAGDAVLRRRDAQGLRVRADRSACFSAPTRRSAWQPDLRHVEGDRAASSPLSRRSTRTSRRRPRSETARHGPAPIPVSALSARMADMTNPCAPQCAMAARLTLTRRRSRACPPRRASPPSVARILVARGSHATPEAARASSSPIWSATGATPRPSRGWTMRGTGGRRDARRTNASLVFGDFDLDGISRGGCRDRGLRALGARRRRHRAAPVPRGIRPHDSPRSVACVRRLRSSS